MRQLSKKEREEIVTKGYLGDYMESKGYITKQYLEDVGMVTKSYLDEVGMATKKDLFAMEKRMDSKFDKHKKEIVGELCAFMDERFYDAFGILNDYNSRVDDHDIRITKLERKYKV